MTDGELLAALEKELSENGCSFSVKQWDRYDINSFSISDDMIMLKYLGKFPSAKYNEWLVRCFGRKKLYHVTEALLDEFEQNGAANGYTWVIGDTLCIINDKRFTDRYIGICLDERYGYARGMIIYMLRYRKIPEVKDMLLTLMDRNDVTVMLYVLSSLLGFPCGEVRRAAERMLLAENIEKRLMLLEGFTDDPKGLERVFEKKCVRLMEKADKYSEKSSGV